MEKEIICNIIREGQDIIPNIELYERPTDYEPSGNYVFVGIRQCGKSYMMYQRIQQLIQEGHSISQIVYINFDDERLRAMKTEELDLIIQAYGSMNSGKPILFFDEIQNVEGWEHFARRLANQKYQVYITGSNAKMLGRDIATTLGGRYWTRNIYPFTFKEFIGNNGVVLDSHWSNSAQKRAEVERAFNEYFHFGGFPEVQTIVSKRLWLNDIYNKIFFSDLIVRNKIRNENALRLTVRRLAESVKQPIAYNRISNLIKSIGVTCHPNTVIEYISYLRDACMIFSLNNYVSKFSEKETIKKHYFIDNGLLNIFLNNDDTSLLENLCAIYLHQHYDEDQLFYYNKNVEVDFYIPSEKTAIQACYNMSDINTAEREINALDKLNSFEPLQRAIIITRDDERMIHTNSGLTIEVKPIWKWLLE
jgi:hypothetical protein